MIDENFDRGYQAARAQLNAGIADSLTRVVEAIGNTFTVLHRIEWNAPWAPPEKRIRRA